MAKYGNWFENAKNVLRKIANIASDGDSFTGDVTGDLTGNVNGNVSGIVYSTPITYDTDGAISLSTGIAILDGSSETGTLELSLADGTPGQTMDFICIDTTVNTVVTPSSFENGVDITFDANNEYLTLKFADSGWFVFGTNATVA